MFCFLELKGTTDGIYMASGKNGGRQCGKLEGWMIGGEGNRTWQEVRLMYALQNNQKPTIASDIQPLLTGKFNNHG
jgi:hypothetical protein